jgi:predicted deacetylase
MDARYIIRLDDASETMNHKNWDLLERKLDNLNIKPVVGVIPNNKDIGQIFKPKDKNFWRRVRAWEKKGWEIAMHGYKHLYHKIKIESSLIPLRDLSEFAEIKKNKQIYLLKKAYNIFKKKKIFPKIWMSPAHTLDDNTLKALIKATPIRLITGGIATSPYVFKNITFVPQQLWWPENKIAGIWTICLHPNTMQKVKIIKLVNIIKEKKFLKKITTFSSVVNNSKPMKFSDKLYRFFFLKNYQLKSVLKNYLKEFKNDYL